MKELIDTKHVIDSLQIILIRLRDLRLTYLEMKDLHHHKRNYSSMHFFEGKSKGLLESIDSLEIYIDRLIIEN